MAKVKELSAMLSQAKEEDEEDEDDDNDNENLMEAIAGYSFICHQCRTGTVHIRIW